jgi:hypothetical protein
MKQIKRLSLAACMFLAAQVSGAATATLTATTAVHTKPDETSTIVTYLKAGSAPTPATTPEAIADTPAGWMAVEIAGPFEAYVNGKDLNKSLDINPGAALHLQPKGDTGLLANYTQGDKVEITGTMKGKWFQIRLDKTLVAYIHASPKATAAAGAATPAGALASAPTPATPATYGVAGPGQPAAQTGGGSDGGSAILPRSFEGVFVSTYRAFAPTRPFPYQLNDRTGARFAYLDASRISQTENLDKFLNNPVSVFGAARNVTGTKDIVILIESIQLR